MEEKKEDPEPLKLLINPAPGVNKYRIPPDLGPKMLLTSIKITVCLGSTEIYLLVQLLFEIFKYEKNYYNHKNYTLAMFLKIKVPGYDTGNNTHLLSNLCL